MPIASDERGVLIFLADWLRSPELREWIVDPAVPFVDILEELRTRYLLDDAQLGLLIARERGALLAALVKVVFRCKLDNPDDWNGCPAPSGAPPSDEPPPDPAPTDPVLHAGPPVGWGGVALVCLESVLLDGRAPELKVDETDDLQILGWSLRSPVKLRFVNDDGDSVFETEMPSVTDELGRSEGTVSVKLPKAGLWSIELVGQGSARSTLFDVILVQP